MCVRSLPRRRPLASWPLAQPQRLQGTSISRGPLSRYFLVIAAQRTMLALKVHTQSEAPRVRAASRTTLAASSPPHTVRSCSSDEDRQAPRLKKPRRWLLHRSLTVVFRLAPLGTGDSHVHVAAQQLQPRHPQEPRCPPVAFAPLSVSSRLTTKRDQNEADAELKAASGKAHATDGMEVSVLKWPDQAPHQGVRRSGVVSHNHPSTDSSGNALGLFPIVLSRALCAKDLRLAWCRDSATGCRSPT